MLFLYEPDEHAQRVRLEHTKAVNCPIHSMQTLDLPESPPLALARRPLTSPPPAIPSIPSMSATSLLTFPSYFAIIMNIKTSKCVDKE